MRSPTSGSKLSVTCGKLKEKVEKLCIQTMGKMVVYTPSICVVLF